MSKKRKILLAAGIIAAVVVAIIVIVAVRNTEPAEDDEIGASAESEGVASLTEDKSVSEEEFEAEGTAGTGGTEGSSEGTSQEISNSFHAAAYGFSFSIPDGYSAESKDGIIYLKKNGTQIAILYIPGEYADGVAVWEQAASEIRKITMETTNSAGVTAERAVKTYGAGNKSTITVGDYTVSQELGELWFRNTGEAENVMLDACNYFTTFQGNGLVLVGTSQTEDTSTVFSAMRAVLETLSASDTQSTTPELTKFTSAYKDGTTFSYPASWKVESEGDLTTITPGEDVSDPYAGFVIELYVDTEGVTADYAQFSRAVETDFLLPAFTGEVSADDFTYTSAVTKMDLNAKIGEKSAVMYQVTDRLFPKSSAVRKLLGVHGDEVESIRYCYRAGGYNCCINFLLPKESHMDMVNQVMGSFYAN